MRADERATTSRPSSVLRLPSASATSGIKWVILVGSRLASPLVSQAEEEVPKVHRRPLPRSDLGRSDRRLNCTLTLSKPVTTGTAEVINCQSVTVHLNHRIPTIQADGCTGCELVLRDRRGFHALYTAKTTQMVVTLPAGEADGQVQRYELDYSDGELELDQFITRFVEDNAPPLTERVIREGAGYPTTVREKEINDARERQLEEALVNFLDSELFPNPAPTPNR